MRKGTGLLLVILSGALLAKEYGTIEGTITEKSHGSSLPGVKVALIEEGKNTTTAQNGYYRLNGVPTGSVRVVVSAIGYNPDTATVTVSANSVTDHSVVLTESIARMMKITVSGHLEGQTRAYNIQKNADNIKSVISSDFMGRFPDQNSAEALQRINGISVQRDQGEGRYVQIRGSKANLSSVQINGVKIPSPEGGGRSVALDVVPADVLGAIEVNKAITPEMDGDAIAGSVDLQTKKATSSKLSFMTTGSLGYNNLINEKENGEKPLNGQFSLSLGKRFGENERFGIIAGGSYMRTNRGSDNTEFDGWDAETGTLEEMELRDYNLTRERIGANLTFDAKLSDNANLFVSGLYNRFGDDENRRRSKINMETTSQNGSTYTVAGPEIFEKDIKDRYEVQDIVSVVAGSEITAGKTTIDFHAGFSYAQEDEPDRHNSDFVLDEDVNYAFNYTLADKNRPTLGLPASYYNSNSFFLDKIEVENNLTTDRNVEGAINVTVPVSSKIELKAGSKGRIKNKERDNQFDEYSSENNPTMTEFTSTYSNPEFYLGNYKNAHSNFADRGKLKEYLKAHKGNTTYFEKEDANKLLEENYAADYKATEKVGAGYLQGKFSLGNFSILAGARGEYTGFDYEGFQVMVEEESLLKTKGRSDRVDVLPMVHLKHSFQDKANVRFAYTRTFARPDFYDLVPYRLINTDDEEIELGNQNLELQFSNNFDLLGEYYLPSIGVISGGIFYKGMSDLIYTKNWKGTDGYEYTQPANANEASLFGAEVNYEMQFTFLPKVLSGLGLGANYTWTTSETKVKNKDLTEREITIPGQSDHILNAFLMYEMDYFNVKVAMNYHSPFLDEVGSKPEKDSYYDKHVQLDLSAAVTPIKGKNLSIFAEFVNLTNEPLRYYTKENGTEFPKQQEYYSWWSHFGVKYGF